MTAHAQTDESIGQGPARPHLVRSRVRRAMSLPTSKAPPSEQVTPSDVTPELAEPATSPTITNDDGFHAVFGVLGIPMLLAFLFSAAAMFYLAYVQVYPTQTANALMDTANLDHGEFWLLKETPLALVVVATVALLLFGVGYIALVAFMLCFRHRALHLEPYPRPKQAEPVVKQRSRSFRLSIYPIHRRLGAKHAANTARYSQSQLHSSKRGEKPPKRVLNSRPSKTKLPPPPASRLHALLLEFTSVQGAYYSYYNAMFDLPKLIFQTTSLITYLNKGFPLPLIHFYSSLLLVNWLISFYRFQRRAMDRLLIVTRLFYLFDLFFAVFAPIVVLVYAYYQFQMDRNEFALKEDALSPGSYDRIARLYADPVQIDVFRNGFSNMQLTKTSYVVAKLCLNTLVLYKWRKILVYLIQRQHAEAKQRVSGVKQPHASQVIRLRGPQRKRHRFFGTMLFFSGIAFVLTYTSVAITSSQHNCAPFHQCRVMSYEWHGGSNDTTCPCIVFIDRDLAPTSFDAWIDPIDVTHALAEVAKPGRLETVQIINRAVPKLPDELKNCHTLQQLILIYSKTQSLQSWVKTFSHMQYIHVESDFVHYPLHTLPSDLFVNMKQLRFL